MILHEHGGEKSFGTSIEGAVMFSLDSQNIAIVSGELRLEHAPESSKLSHVDLSGNLDRDQGGCGNNVVSAHDDGGGVERMM